MASTSIPSPFPSSPPPHPGPRIVPSLLAVHSSCSYFIACSPIRTLPCICLCLHRVHQHSIQCPVRSSARPSTIRGRYSLTPPRMIGRRGTRATCLLTGIRCYCMDVRRMRLGSDHPSLGWVTSEFNRFIGALSFLVFFFFSFLSRSYALASRLECIHEFPSTLFVSFFNAIFFRRSRPLSGLTSGSWFFLVVYRWKPLNPGFGISIHKSMGGLP